MIAFKFFEFHIRIIYGFILFKQYINGGSVSTVEQYSKFPCNIQKISLLDNNLVPDSKLIENIISNPSDVPVIYVGHPGRNYFLSEMVSEEALTSSPNGDVEVSLTSSNTYSHGFKKMKLKEYINYSIEEGKNK